MTFLQEIQIIGDCEFFHNIFCCPQCGKEIEYSTQIGYEDNEKRLVKIYNALLEYVKPEQIKKVWVDQNDNASENMADIETLYKVFYTVRIGEREFKIPCGYTSRSRFYELPIQIKKDKGIKKALAELKQLVGERGDLLSR